MEIATLIFILSFLAIVATLVVSTTRYMCEKKGKVSKRVPLSEKVSITKGQLKEIGLNTLNAYAEKYEPVVGKLSYEFNTSWYQKEVNETQEKWKETVPKHSTRIKLRASRKLRNKRKGHGKGVKGKEK